MNRIAGPFQSPPFSHFIVSPIAIVPKKEPGSFRVIHDLSQPRPGSVNSRIPDCYASVHYETFDRVVDLVLSHGQSCLLAKCDVKEGFRNLPVSPSDYHLLGFKFDQLYYYDKVVPDTGSSLSPGLLRRQMRGHPFGNLGGAGERP